MTATTTTTITSNGYKVNVGGAWKTSTALEINIGGTWKTTGSQSSSSSTTYSK